MIDTHCHLNDDKLKDDLDKVVNNFLSAGVDNAICVGWDFGSSIEAKDISDKYSCVYYAIGVHPDECNSFNYEDMDALIKKCLSESKNKLVAIGEIGLDYYHNTENKEKQKQVFVSQINLAKKYNLPIIIHCRDAYGDMLEILKANAPFSSGVVFHCYSGSLEYAQILIKMGIKISFTGTVTYKNAHNVQAVATNLPLSSIFFETDSPYLSPVPHRGERNEPKNVVDIAKFVADLRGIEVDELINITNNNAREFFKLMKK